MTRTRVVRNVVLLGAVAVVVGLFVVGSFGAASSGTARSCGPSLNCRSPAPTAVLPTCFPIAGVPPSESCCSHPGMGACPHAGDGAAP